MPRLEWGAVGERFYETGVDRGVLFINGGGVPWNGLISVSESPTSGESKAYFIDGIKYSSRIGSGEFEADISAYTYPVEFAECDGTASIANGLFSTQQKRSTFGFSYRSGVGNDVNGMSHGYKLHLVYNALAQPSGREYATTGDDLEPLNFSWHVITRPPRLDDRRPAAHFVIESRLTPAPVLKQIEDILYGTDSAYSRLPSVEELYFIFESFNTPGYDGGTLAIPYFDTLDGGVVPETQTSTVDGGFYTIIRENLVPNPAPAALTGWGGSYGSGGAGTYAYVASGGPTGGGFVRRTWTTAETAATHSNYVDGRATSAPLTVPVAAGQVLSGSIMARASWAVSLRVGIFFYDAAGNSVGSISYSPTSILAANTWTKLTISGITAPAGALYALVGAFGPSTGALATVGSTLDSAQALLEVAATVGNYFDGGTPDAGDISYDWYGAANTSRSFANKPN